MTGTSIAQAIPLAISPILTRVYTPEDFGIFALYMSIVSMIAVVVTGRYEQAIVIPKNDRYAMHLVILSMIISFFISVLCLVVIVCFKDGIVQLLNNQDISDWLYFIPLSVFLTGIYQSLNYWNNRKKNYKILAGNRVVQSSTTSAMNLLLGMTKVGSNGLVIGSISGQIIATFVLLKMTLNEKFKNIEQVKLIALGKKYIDFPRKSAIGAFFNTFSYQIEYILFTIFYTVGNVGMYYFINKIISIPKLFLSNAIWQSFLSHTHESKKYIFKSMLAKQEALIKFSMLPVLSSIAILPNIFVFVFGNNWMEVTAYIPPLIVAMHLNFIVASFSLFVVINRPDMEMKFNVFLALFKVVGISLSYLLFENILISIYVLACIQIIMFIWLGSWNYKQLGQRSLFFVSLYMKHFIYISVPLLLIFWVALNQIFLITLLSYFIVNISFFLWIKR